MSTISVPLPQKLEKFIDDQISQGKYSNKAEVVRRALVRFEEEEAVRAVLETSNEPTLYGDLDDLAKKLK